jgi:hypothetical protein
VVGILGATIQDARILHVAEQSMLKVAADRDERITAARHEAVPAPQREQTIAKSVPMIDTSSHTVAFETRMSKHPGNQEGRRKRIRVSVFARRWAEHGPRPRMDQMIAKYISMIDTNSHNVAFETGMSECFRNLGGRKAGGNGFARAYSRRVGHIAFGGAGIACG